MLIVDVFRLYTRFYCRSHSLKNSHTWHTAEVVNSDRRERPKEQKHENSEHQSSQNKTIQINNNSHFFSRVRWLWNSFAGPPPVTRYDDWVLFSVIIACSGFCWSLSRSSCRSSSSSSRMKGAPSEIYNDQRGDVENWRHFFCGFLKTDRTWLSRNNYTISL